MFKILYQNNKQGFHFKSTRVFTFQWLYNILFAASEKEKKIQHFVLSLFRPRSQGQEYICTESFLCRHRPSLRMSVLGCKDRKSPGQAKKVESQFKNSFNRDISISNIFTSQTRLKILLSNCEHLKTFRNVDCVLANWNKVQDTQANLKTTN